MTAPAGLAAASTGDAAVPAPAAATWHRPTLLRVGTGAARQAVAQAAAQATAAGTGPALVVIDAALPEHLLGGLLGAPRRGSVEVLAQRGAGTLADVELLAESVARTGQLVAIGGGSLLDLVALGRATVAHPELPGLIRRGGARPGLVLCPSTPAAPTPQLTAVPTTLGTAAEVSAAATVLVEGRRKLVLGEALAPEAAALDPAATRTLPAALLREGVLEAICRLFNLYLIPPGGQCPAVADAEVLELLRLLGAAGGRAAGDLAAAAAIAGPVSGPVADPAGGVPDALRVDLALLSARTVLGLAMLGRDPFVGKLWYLANELSVLTGSRKMTATIAVLPRLWQRVLAGDRRFGDPARLHTAWAALRVGLPGLPPDPVTGLRRLAARWHLPGLTGPLPEAAPLAEHALRAWGGGLPMLGAFRRSELRELYQQVLDDAAAGSPDTPEEYA